MITGIPKEITDVIQADQFDSELRDRIVAWTEESFSLFLHRNSKKIAKKLSSSTNIEDQRDVRLELFVARMFLRAGCKVTYEPKPRKHRGPDFLIEFGKDYFYCEVSRIRENLSLYPEPREVQGVSVRDIPYDPQKQFRIIGDIICKKLFQMETEHPNVIYIRSNRSTIHKKYLEMAFDELLEEAHSGNTGFFVKKKFKDESDFLERMSACSVVILDDLWMDFGNTDITAMVYTNQEAKHTLSKVMYDVIRHAITTPFRYIAPFESVAEEDWEVLKGAESFDVTQDPVFQMEGYDSDAPADFSTNLDKYLYGKEKTE